MLEITTPASTTDLTTPEFVLRKWNGSDPDDDHLADVISAASRFAAHWCRREFVNQSYEELVEAPERLRLCLSESPVTAVATVESDGEAITNYRIFESSGILLKTDNVPWTGPVPVGGILGHSVLAFDREPTLDIAYTAGWVSRAMDSVDYNLPADLEDSVAYLAREMLKQDLEESAGEAIEKKVGNFHSVFQSSDPMNASGAGYWAETIADPTMIFLPNRVRRVWLGYRKFIL